jgi:hypothetical protein
MKLLAKNTRGCQIELTSEEIRIMSQALNEICYGIKIHEDDFHARIGATKGEARRILDRLLEIYHTVAEGDP